MQDIASRTHRARVCVTTLTTAALIELYARTRQLANAPRHTVLRNFICYISYEGSTTFSS